MSSSYILSDNGVSSGSAGLKSSAGNDGVLVLQTANSSGTATNAVYIDTNQNVGVGVTPSAWGSGYKAIDVGLAGSVYGDTAYTTLILSANSYTNGTNYIYKQSAGATRYTQFNGAHSWYNAASGTAGNPITFTQAMTLTSGGDLFVGDTSGSLASRLVVRGITPADASGAYPATIELTDTRAYNSTSPQPGGGISFGYKYNTGGSVALGPAIQGFKENSTDGNYAGGLRFLTRANGSNPTEAARIDSSGNLLVGATSTQTTPQRLTLTYAGGVRWGVGPTSGSSTFVIKNDSDQGVYLSSGSTSWSAYSDERVKDIIEPITDAASKVSTLRAVIGKYKKDTEGTRRSFLIAQDVQAVLPEAVNAQDDEIGTLGVQYTDVIPLLVAAIKEQQTLIQTLTERITALEAK